MKVSNLQMASNSQNQGYTGKSEKFKKKKAKTLHYFIAKFAVYVLLCRLLHAHEIYNTTCRIFQNLIVQECALIDNGFYGDGDITVLKLLKPPFYPTGEASKSSHISTPVHELSHAFI